MAILVITYDNTAGKFLVQKLGSAQIADEAVTSAKLTSALIADILAGVADGGVTSAKIASGAVGDGHLYPNAVTSAKIASGIVGLPHLQAWASGKLMVGQGTTTTPIIKDHLAAIAFVIDGGGEVITSGTQGKLEITFPATIAHCRLLADQSGCIGIDLRKDTYAGYEGIIATDSICSGTRPILSSAMKYEDTTLTGWNKKIASGDILAYIVDAGISNITRCTVSLGVYK